MKDKVKSQPVTTLTLGCRLNLHESEVMQAHAEAAGLSNTIIVNTCAVTNNALSNSRQTIRRATKQNPNARIIVTGCAAQINPKTYANLPGVSHVLGNGEKLRAESFLPAALERKHEPTDIMSVKTIDLPIYSPGNPRKTHRSRAIVQVQNGCDHRCTFCIIPYGRGNSRSRPTQDVIREIRQLVKDGYNEVVLSGVDISSWGEDLPNQPKLGGLVRSVLHEIPDLARLRLSSIDCAEIDDELFDVIGSESRFTPYLHLSLQHGDDLILKRMKRRHLRADAIKLCQRLRASRPDICFGADIIAGFPTESEAAFDNALSIVDECRLTWLHVFPYSARIGTPAAKMPQLDRALIKERAARLRQKGDEVKVKHLQKRAAAKGLYDIALIEHTTDKGEQIGRLGDFSPVKIPPHSAKPGTLCPVRITGYTDMALIGDVL